MTPEERRDHAAAIKRRGLRRFRLIIGCIVVICGSSIFAAAFRPELSTCIGAATGKGRIVAIYLCSFQLRGPVGILILAGLWLSWLLPIAFGLFTSVRDAPRLARRREQDRARRARRRAERLSALQTQSPSVPE